MFEFDPAKSEANLTKHGIDFEAAQALWQEAVFAEGPTNSSGEERWMRVAMAAEKLWAAIFTVRDGRIRLISVRRARANEAKQYDSKVDQR